MEVFVRIPRVQYFISTTWQLFKYNNNNPARKLYEGVKSKYNDGKVVQKTPVIFRTPDETRLTYCWTFVDYYRNKTVDETNIIRSYFLSGGHARSLFFLPVEIARRRRFENIFTRAQFRAFLSKRPSLLNVIMATRDTVASSGIARWARVTIKVRISKSLIIDHPIVTRLLSDNYGNDHRTRFTIRSGGHCVQRNVWCLNSFYSVRYMCLLFSSSRRYRNYVICVYINSSSLVCGLCRRDGKSRRQ